MQPSPQIVCCSRPSMLFARSIIAGLLVFQGGQDVLAMDDGAPAPAPVLRLSQTRPTLVPPTNSTSDVTELRKSSPQTSPLKVLNKESTEKDSQEITPDDGWRARKAGDSILPTTKPMVKPADPTTTQRLPERAELAPDEIIPGIDTSAPIGSGLAPTPPVSNSTAPEQSDSAPNSPLQPVPSETIGEVRNEGETDSPESVLPKHNPSLTDKRAEDTIDALSDEEEIVQDLRLPLRRPTIHRTNTPPETDAQPLSDISPSPRLSLDSPLPNETPNDRSRKLQEEIEDYESQSEMQSPPAADDEYENPDLEPEPDAAASSPKGRQDRPETPAREIPVAIQRMQAPIAQCLQYYYRRPENARERTPWGMLHGILPFGIDSQIDTGRQRFNAIAWLAGNNPGRNLKIFTVDQRGRLVAREGVGLQGHQAQLLAIFAQVGVPYEYPLIVNGRRFTMQSLVESEMAACKSGAELTFTLIGLSHYLPTDTQWQTADGEMWNFDRLLREELKQPVVGAACGGTHRLMGLTFALQQRKLEGLPITGQWARAETYINDFIDYAWELQNRDGSFSTNWFEGREDNGKTDRKLQTTGHILEWLVFALPAEELTDPRVTRAVTFVANSMIRSRGDKLDVGPKGHALRSLSLYHTRVFESDRPWLGSPSSVPQSRTAQSRSPRR